MKSPFADGFNYQDNLLPEYQRKLGHDVFVLTGTLSRNRKGEKIKVQPGKVELGNGVQLIRIPSGGKIRQLLGYYPQIKKYINEVSPDFIFVHSLCTFAPAYAVSYKRKHKDVTLVADNHQDNQNSRLVGIPFAQIMSMWRMLWKCWIPHFKHIFGTTSWRSDFAINEFGIPKEKVETLVMGVDSARFPQDTSTLRKEMRKELGFSDDVFLFVTGGKISSRFHRMETIRAFTRFASKKSRLLVFGSVEDALKEEFDLILRKDERIRYIGFIDSKVIYNYFFASDFGLFSGAHSVLWEEAVGCSLPCLFSQYAENDHVQVCGNCIQILDGSNVEEIGRVINRVESDHIYYVGLKENAKQAAPLFSYYEVAKKSIS